ncbi:MAG: helix-turn-helix domain-containing protein [Bacilli bacterium]
MSYAIKIKTLRTLQKMKQKPFVEGVCSVAYLSRIENGDTKPSLKFLETLSEKYTIPFEIVKEEWIEVHNKEIERCISSYAKTKKLSFVECYQLELALHVEMEISTLFAVHSVLLDYYVVLEDWNNALRIYEEGETVLRKMESDKLPKSAFAYYIAVWEQQIQTHNYIGSDATNRVLITLCAEDEWDKLGRVYYQMSLTQQRLCEKQDGSRIYAEKAISCYEMSGNKKGILDCLVAVSVQCHIDRYFQEALQYIDQAETLNEEIGDKRLAFVLLVSRARVHQKMADFETALHFFEQSLQAPAKKERDDVFILRGIAESFVALERWSDALAKIEEIERLADVHGLLFVQIETGATKAMWNKKQGNDFEYEKIMRKTIRYAIDKNQKLQAKELAEELGEHYYHVPVYQMSAKYFRLAHRLLKEND